MAEIVIVECPFCRTRNRIPVARWGDRGAVCGKCKRQLDTSALYPDKPVFVTDGTFKREVLQFPGPVVLEFYSPS